MNRPDEIIALERAALDRWGQGDPQGFLEIMSPEVTYFDPVLEQRIDGLEALRAWLESFAGTFKIDRYEMSNARVQGDDSVAVLTFNLVNCQNQPGGGEAVLNRWNSTEVYHRADGRWRLVHSHWSYTRPTIESP